jgi:hypothetical protein
MFPSVSTRGPRPQLSVGCADEGLALCHMGHLSNERTHSRLLTTVTGLGLVVRRSISTIA